MQQYKQIDIMFFITNSTLMDRTYPNALAYIKIEGVIWVKQMLWAVKVWAKMVWKKPSSFSYGYADAIVEKYFYFHEETRAHFLLFKFSNIMPLVCQAPIRTENMET